MRRHPKGQVVDPYGVHELTPEDDCVGRLVFVRSPKSFGWVSLYDLPEESARALYRRIDREGIPDNDDWPFGEDSAHSQQ